ncbi:hypothetical protein [Mechercharimyces sp. CAU 1602]|nr:hypothetical protein [Mechercharimyces sp. CAU 1602]MCS1350297.1 hypothetical protein [Mechercharimyces sp. CAU 1602]
MTPKYRKDKIEQALNEAYDEVIHEIRKRLTKPSLEAEVIRY